MSNNKKKMYYGSDELQYYESHDDYLHLIKVDDSLEVFDFSNLNENSYEFQRIQFLTKLYGEYNDKRRIENMKKYYWDDYIKMQGRMNEVNNNDCHDNNVTILNNNDDLIRQDNINKEYEKSGNDNIVTILNDDDCELSREDNKEYEKSGDDNNYIMISDDECDFQSIKRKKKYNDIKRKKKYNDDNDVKRKKKYNDDNEVKRNEREKENGDEKVIKLCRKPSNTITVTSPQPNIKFKENKRLNEFNNFTHNNNNNNKIKKKNIIEIEKKNKIKKMKKNKIKEKKKNGNDKNSNDNDKDKSNNINISKDNIKKKKNVDQIKQKKKFQCELCMSSFTKLGWFNKHKLLHTTKKPYTCDVCLITYERLEEFIEHKGNPFCLKTHHQCQICSIYLKTKRKLKNHQSWCKIKLNKQ